MSVCSNLIQRQCLRRERGRAEGGKEREEEREEKRRGERGKIKNWRKGKKEELEEVE